VFAFTEGRETFSETIGDWVSSEIRIINILTLSKISGFMGIEMFSNKIRMIKDGIEHDRITELLERTVVGCRILF